ncbi:MAG: class I adenylate-forming enzyme family protein [Mycobacterium sp.]
MTVPRPTSSTLGELLRELARRHPARPAISFEDRDYSFGEVDQQVDRYAKGLLAAGIRRGDSVAVLAGNRPSWLYSALGAARIGAVTVPVNTWYKQDELQYALGHGDVKALLFYDRLRDIDYAPLVSEAIPWATVDRVDPDETDENGSQLPLLRHVIELGEHRLAGATSLTEFLNRGAVVTDAELVAAESLVRSDDLAFLIYTSGSTARPKCVALEHHPMIVNTFNIGERQALDAEDRSFVATPLFYGLGVIQALGATWTHGACVVLMEAYEPGRALEILERQRCTVYYGLGNMTRSLVGHPDHRKRKLVLRKGVLGLSAADRKLARTELGLDLGTSIYGLTESYGLCALTDAHDAIELSEDTIGTALPGWDIRIADPETDLPVPAGSVGQILIRGHLMRGYFKAPDQTRQVVTTDGYFKTGDLGWLDERNHLHFHSRLSELMKPGGINVSPVEVELLAGEIPGVREVHAVGIPDPVRGEAIVVFVDADQDAVAPDDIRRHIRESAAKYKAPQHVLYRAGSELPRVASGKVPKAELRTIALHELGLDASGMPVPLPATSGATTAIEDQRA